MSFEIVFLVGPRYCGQHIYRLERYRVVPVFSLEEFFQSQPQANLHIAILEIVNKLRKHGKMIIDDEMLLSSSTRTSILTGIKKKLHNITAVCCHFLPKYAQCQWSSQWYIGQQIIRSLQESPSVQDIIIHSGTVSTVQSNSLVTFHYCDLSLLVTALTLDLEKFDSVRHFEVNPICESQYEFTFPGLLIEYPALIKQNKPNKPVEIREGMLQACQIWLQSHPAGHIIIICYKENEYSAVISHDFMKSVMLYLVLFQFKNKQKLPCPTHCVSIGSSPNILSLVPWIQYMFLISLYHKGTLFVYQFQALSEQLGTRSIRVSLFTDKPRSIVNALPYNPRVPPMVPNTIYVNPTTITTNRTTVLPLYPIANMREDSNCKLVTISISGHHSYSIRLGMCYKDEYVLRNHEKLCQSALMPVTNNIIDFCETTSSLLFASPRGLKDYVTVDLSKETMTEMAAQRMLVTMSTKPIQNKPRPSTPKRALPVWMLKERGKDSLPVKTTKGVKRALVTPDYNPQLKKPVEEPYCDNQSSECLVKNLPSSHSSDTTKSTVDSTDKYRPLQIDNIDHSIVIIDKEQSTSNTATSDDIDALFEF